MKRDPQGAKYLAPLVWQGPASKNKSKTSLPAAEAARPCQAVHSRPFPIRLCPLHFPSHTSPFPCLIHAFTHAVSSGPNENSCSLQDLAAKFPSLRSSPDLPSHPQTALMFLIPCGVTVPRMPWDGVTSPQLGTPKVMTKAKLTSRHPPSAGGLSLRAKSQGKREP